LDRPNSASLLVSAFSLLNKVQNPANCSSPNVRYAVVRCGHKAGFASQYQLTAISWLKVLALLDYSVPVLIVGRLQGYTDGKDCDHVHNDWTCYFLPMSACQRELLASGSSRVEVSAEQIRDMKIDESHLIPAAFREKGMAWWWGVVQAYMLRVQPNVQAYIREQMQWMATQRLINPNLNSNPNSNPNPHTNTTPAATGFPLGADPVESMSVSVSVAGLHIRHGDKGIDGFRSHTLEAQLLAAQRSSECLSPVQLVRDSCAVKGAIASSGSAEAAAATTATGVAGIAPTAPATSAGSASKSMKIFVASDDKQVLAAARSKGFLVTRGGVSQETADRGMAATLQGRPNMSHNASLEILADIYFLSRCTTLVGTASSQVFRVAVGVSTALGLLQSAIVMDYDQLPKIRRWTTSFLPLPEAFIDGRAGKR
jgi:hypothetical protein